MFPIIKKFAGNRFLEKMLLASTMEAFLRHSFLMIAVKDLDGNHVFASDTHLKAFGFQDVEQMNDVSLTPGWPQWMRDKWTENDREVAKKRMPITGFEKVSMDPFAEISDENNVQEFFDKKLPVFDLDGEVRHVAFMGLQTGAEDGIK